MIADTDTSSHIASARPGMTAALMSRTGLDEAVLRELVHRFYAKARADALQGPVFAARIADWPSHPERLTTFWSSVALMTGRYSARPVPADRPLPVGAAHFDRWFALFRETAHEIFPPAGTDHVIERAERIARSLRMAVEDAERNASGTAPSLRQGFTIGARDKDAACLGRSG